MRELIIFLPLTLVTSVCGLASVIAEGCAKLAGWCEDAGIWLIEWADAA